MNSEDDVWGKLAYLMNDRWVAKRVENSHGNPGFPDVLYSMRTAHRRIRGLIELKFVPELRIHGMHSSERKYRIGLKREQATFLLDHGQAAGFCYIIIGIGKTNSTPDAGYLYGFTWHHAEALLEKQTWAGLLSRGVHLNNIDKTIAFLEGRTE